MNCVRNPSGNPRPTEHKPSADKPPLATTLRIASPPQFLTREGNEILGLRKKDLALLTFLWLSGVRKHQRATLAAMLWANRTGAKARHSLTQTLRRIQPVVDPNALCVSTTEVVWKKPSPSVLELLHTAGHSLESLDDISTEPLSLDAFFAGDGAALFEAWCEQRCSAFRQQLVNECRAAARTAEAAGDLELPFALAQSAVVLDPFDEDAHRRIMRLGSALGQKSQALLHYRKLEAFLESELGETPDPQTVELARMISENCWELNEVPVTVECEGGAIASTH